MADAENVKKSRCTPQLPLSVPGHSSRCACDTCLNWVTPFWGGLWRETLDGSGLPEMGFRHLDVAFVTATAIGHCLAGATSGTERLREALDEYGAESVIFSLLWYIRAMDDPRWNTWGMLGDASIMRRGAEHYAKVEKHDRRLKAQRREWED
jgi:hypothetical protein